MKDDNKILKNNEILPVKNLNIPAVRDSLRAYLTEISRYPLLTPEEEKKLVEEMKKGSIEAAKKLVTSNLRLVVKIALEYKSGYKNIMDLIQEGNIGLMKAISMYNPKKGAKLSYYASWWIKSYILKFLISNFRLVKIGTTQTQKKLFYNLMKEKEKLEKQGKSSLPKVISKRLDVKEKDIIEMSRRLDGSAELSIDQKIKDDEGEKTSLSFLSKFQDESARPDKLIEEKEEKEKLKKELEKFSKTLNKKEKEILFTRLLSEAPKTLQEIADNNGISKERTRQLEARILKRLREQLEEFKSN